MAGGELRRETKDDVPLSRQAAHGDREGSWLELAPRISSLVLLAQICTGHLANVHEGAGMFYQPKFKLSTFFVIWMSRPVVIEVLGKVNLSGTGGNVSESSPGVFLQALLYSLGAQSCPGGLQPG
uniref:Uncharacterized protein n=1 Tax=Oryza barthii TaxID=65489 RepID=A0A0D3H6H7_9ORYZ